MFAMDMQVEQFLEFRIHALGEKKNPCGQNGAKLVFLAKLELLGVLRCYQPSHLIYRN
jgi:hypothetical protein